LRTVTDELRSNLQPVGIRKQLRYHNQQFRRVVDDDVVRRYAVNGFPGWCKAVPRTNEGVIGVQMNMPEKQRLKKRINPYMPDLYIKDNCLTFAARRQPGNG
jgi:hypothetical protein